MGKSVEKKIAKLNKIPHPKGRKTAQLTKKTIREAGREKSKLQHQMRVNVLGEKVLWFRENLDPVETYTPELTIKLIEKYLGRFDEELKLIELKHTIGNRKGRQHASREDIIKMNIKNETNEFLTSGIEMPDLLNPKQLRLLKEWSGELRYLQNFKLVRYSKSKLVSLIKNTKDGESNNSEKIEEEKVIDPKNVKSKNENEINDASQTETQMDVEL